MGRSVVEVDLHGMDREAARRRLRDAFETARRAGATRMRVVHGKGSGVLRLMVWEELEDHPAVEGLRLAKAPDGGEGATEVRLRGDGGRWSAS